MEENGTGPKKKLTKKDRAELLRKTVDTIGREGQPGEQIQNVISVGMLSEGWDAKTVTHIMGLRAFTPSSCANKLWGADYAELRMRLIPRPGCFNRSTSTYLAFHSRFFRTRAAPMLRRHPRPQARPGLSLSQSDVHSMR